MADPSMIDRLWMALQRAVLQLPDRRLLMPLLATLLWTALVFVLVWLGALHEFHRVAGRFGDYGPFAWAGVVVSLVLATWLGFAIIANLILLLYTDRIVAAVEARHYPSLPPAGAMRWRDALWSGVRLLLLTIVGNLVLLPAYFFLPGMNLVLFLGLNGYVLARAYFDAVTLRRMDDRTARRIWRAQGGLLVVNGALLAFLMTIPVLNLVIPIVGLAATVHLLEGRLGAEA